MDPRRHKKGARGLQELHLDPPGLQSLGKNSKDFNIFIKPMLSDKVSRGSSKEAQEGRKRAPGGTLGLNF